MQKVRITSQKILKRGDAEEKHIFFLDLRNLV